MRLSICLCLSWLACLGCGGSLQHYRSRSLADPSQAGQARLRIEQALPLVEIRCAGRSIPVILDLGSFAGLSLPAATLSELGATPTGRTRTFSDARGNELTARIYSLASVELAGVVWRDLEVQEAIWHPDYAPPVRAGHIGRGLLDALVLDIDLAHRRLRILRSDSPVGLASGITVPFVDDHGLVIAATLDSKPVDLLLDSAVTANLLVPTPSQPASQTPVSRVLRLHGSWTATETFILAPLEGLPQAGILGLPFLLRHRVIVDLARHTLSLPVNGAPQPAKKSASPATKARPKASRTPAS